MLRVSRGRQVTFNKLPVGAKPWPQKFFKKFLNFFGSKKIKVTIKPIHKKLFFLKFPSDLKFWLWPQFWQISKIKNVILKILIFDRLFMSRERQVMFDKLPMGDKRKIDPKKGGQIPPPPPSKRIGLNKGFEPVVSVFHRFSGF